MLCMGGNRFLLRPCGRISCRCKFCYVPSLCHLYFWRHTSRRHDTAETHCEKWRAISSRLRNKNVPGSGESFTTTSTNDSQCCRLRSSACERTPRRSKPVCKNSENKSAKFQSTCKAYRTTCTPQNWSI